MGSQRGTLTELEQDAWPDPGPGATGLVRTCVALRDKPLAEFTVEDLRIMLGQRIGVRHLLPRAVDVLLQDPTAAGDVFPGDLLGVVLRLPDAAWAPFPQQRAELLARLGGAWRAPTGLIRALTEDDWAPQPDAATRLLLAHRAQPRLGAHLRLVHDVAHRLTGWLARVHPALAFDREAVLFGAATHDLGKVLHPEELSAPGTRHEPAGQRLLLAAGVPEPLARFAGTHGGWDAGSPTEDLLVSLADKIWKAKRVEDLEQLVADRITASGADPWDALLALDGKLERLAAGAEWRLAFQNAYPMAES
jgi:hypothetical protein